MLRVQTKDVLFELSIWGYFGVLWKCSIVDTKTHDFLQKYREELSQTEQGKLFFRLHDQEEEIKEKIRKGDDIKSLIGQLAQVIEGYCSLLPEEERCGDEPSSWIRGIANVYRALLSQAGEFPMRDVELWRMTMPSDSDEGSLEDFPGVSCKIPPDVMEAYRNGASFQEWEGMLREKLGDRSIIAVFILKKRTSTVTEQEVKKLEDFVSKNPADEDALSVLSYYYWHDPRLTGLLNQDKQRGAKRFKDSCSWHGEGTLMPNGFSIPCSEKAKRKNSLTIRIYDILHTKRCQCPRNSLALPRNSTSH